jgi:MerR family transcriptional regulator/heat shock protein HspR
MRKINRKTSNTTSDKKDRPVYPIGIVAEMVGITEQTIRLYEKRGLIHPVRRNKHRYFSENDVSWLICIRDAIHKDKISIEGLIKLLNYAPCWEIRECTEEVRKDCTAFINKNKNCWEAKQHLCADANTEGCSSCPIYIVGNKREWKKQNSKRGEK